MKFSKLKCQILHLGWNNIGQQYILWEWLENSPADRDLIASRLSGSQQHSLASWDANQHHQLVSGDEGAELFSLVSSDRTCGNGSKLHQGRFSLDIRKNFLAERIKHWNKLPRQVVDAPSLTVFQRHLGNVLNTRFDLASHELVRQLGNMLTGGPFHMKQSILSSFCSPNLSS